MENLFITNKTRDLLEKDLFDLLKISRVLKKGDLPSERQLNRLRFAFQFFEPRSAENSKVDETLMSVKVMTAIADSTYSDDLERGSASFPVYNSNWSVGIFGSVFCDMILDGSNFRVHLITKNNCEKHGSKPSQLKDTIFIYVEEIKS